MLLEAWLLESGARLLAWGARHPRHIAAILTATAIPLVAGLLLLDSGVSTEAGWAMLITAVVGGVALAVRAEGLGADPHRGRDWAVVIVGTVAGLAAAFGFVVFFGIFGSLLGLHAAAAASGVWLALRLAVAVVRSLRNRSSHPT